MGKVVPLSTLIRDHVRAGMCLHLGVTHLFPHAAVAEVIRAMAGTDPRFTLVAAGISGSGIAMLHLGMVERVITSYAGDIYPSPAPNAVVQRVYADRSVAFEHWSLLTLVQRMAAAADELDRRITARAHDTILAGQGYANLAAWIAAARHPGVDLAAEIGMLGYTPRPGNPFLFNFANLPTASALATTLDALGTWVGGGRARCIGALGAGQVDRRGSVNSTAVPPVFHLVGSGGANDVASAAGEVVLACPADPMRLVEQVPYRTFCGDRVRALVTTEGVLRKRAGDHELVLCAVFPRGRPLEDAAAAARARFGWPLRVSDALEALPAPDEGELVRLREYDPRGAFLDDG